jgi:hypothetical protein
VSGVWAFSREARLIHLRRHGHGTEDRGHAREASVRALPWQESADCSLLKHIPCGLRRLSRLYMYNAPFIFNAFWVMCQPFLDEATLAKVCALWVAAATARCARRRSHAWTAPAATPAWPSQPPAGAALKYGAGVVPRQRRSSPGLAHDQGSTIRIELVFQFNSIQFNATQYNAIHRR